MTGMAVLSIYTFLAGALSVVTYQNHRDKSLFARTCAVILWPFVLAWVLVELAWEKLRK